MLMKSFAALFAITLVATVVGQCAWEGTAPFCGGSCPSNRPQKLTVGKGGCNNGNTCYTGTKAYCCESSYRRNNCEWYGTAPFCSGECPSGKVRETTDGGGDGSGCATGCKVLCCDRS